jgi:chromosome segregation ATPase
VDAAASLLESATRAADTIAPRISSAGVSDVSDELQDAAHDAHRARQLLDAIDRTAADLAGAGAALAELVRDSESDLADAKRQLEAAPDADTGEAIIRAISSVETALTTGRQSLDPVAELDRVGAAVAELDLALASARNQQQRLEHARAALAGTLVSAKSQIAEARNYIGSRGGGVDARTRLAEAERQLMLAEAAADPVEALDTARRAVTHARDADALARFDTMN